MIQFKARIVDKANNIPVIKDAEIDDFALAVLKDYKPSLLREPAPVDFEDFLTFYLEAEIEFCDIFYAKDENPIWGMTAFDEGKVKIFDEEGMCVKQLFVSPRTVIIDNFVMEPGKEGLALFTALHEGGHLLLHNDVFKKDYKDTALMVCCRRKHIEGGGRQEKERTPADWLEHQANCFAASFSMPNVTFVPFVKDILLEHDVMTNFITLGIDEDLDILGRDLMPEFISETYGVSKQAARVKLRKCGFINDSVCR